MRQRVAFLRTLLSGKPVLCLDEPFGALDALTRAEMRDWLGSALGREPRTTLLVTHDVEEAAVLADRIVVLTPAAGARQARHRRPAAATAPRHRPRARRDPRARDGGAARVIARAADPARARRRLGGVRALGNVDDFILPAPTQVAEALWDDRSLLWHNLLVTAQEVGLGILVALVLGAALAIAIHLSPDAAPRRSIRCSSARRPSRSSSSRRC